MGLEFVILFAHIFSNDVNSMLNQYEQQRPLDRVQVQQQIIIEQNNKNTKRILEAIKRVGNDSEAP